MPADIRIIGSAARSKAERRNTHSADAFSRIIFDFPRLLLVAIGALLAFARFTNLWADASDDPPKPTSRSERAIAGWTVRVDDRLLAPPHDALGQRALKLLEARLTDIGAVVAPEGLEKLRAVPIILDLTHGGLTSMQYHPSPEWLEGHGYARDLAKCVHLPDAARFVDPRHQHVQPWSVLHELAHAYHDQVLGFDEPRIRAAWERYCASGHGEAVLHIGGKRIRHYALTDHKEFFAEMSEAYFGVNDFFPFNHAELQEAEPETLALLAEIWGPLP